MYDSKQTFPGNRTIHKSTHSAYDSTRKAYIDLNTEKIPAPRRGSGHKAPFLSKRLFASYICCKREKGKLSLVEHCLGYSEAGLVPLSSWSLENELHGLFICLLFSGLFVVFNIHFHLIDFLFEAYFNFVFLGVFSVLFICLFV